MNANAVPLLAIFEKKLRLEVPLFQRQYVWNREQQWEPLWDDIRRKFTEYLEGRTDAPIHFLGAMVLDQKQTPTTHVEKRQVIDGQQRLTTLQIFLAAFRDFCREQGSDDLADECESFTVNKGMMADPNVDKFKVWPTQLDRPQFGDTITAGSRAALEGRHPLRKRKYARNYDPRPRMVEAYLYFYAELKEYFLGTSTDKPVAAEQPVANRLEESFQALKNSLQVVVIDLDHGDDAQVIFETLNARGQPLLPADLLRNFIFLRAARQGESQEAPYEQYWRMFDDPFWREEVRQGRLTRPRSDLFMQHFLSSQQMADIPIRHLYVEYKYWIERKKPFASVRDELATLARYGTHFRRISQPKHDDPSFPLATFLDSFDLRTADPVLLAVMDANLPDDAVLTIGTWIESYLLRRAVCGWTTKNYTRVFLALIRSLHRDVGMPGSVYKHLSDLRGESQEWPTDDTFASAWQSQHAYRLMNSPKIVHILRRLNERYMSNKAEKITIGGSLTVEHLMPQEWVANWPLPDGSKGMAFLELANAGPDEPRAIATRRRNAALQTLGNLTILTNALNSSVSNAAWSVKKPAVLQSSLLPINQQLQPEATWDESKIDARSKRLLQHALAIWPGPAKRTS